MAAQVALARQESPHRGQVLLGLVHDLATDLPHTHRALREGRLNEHRALLVARETGCLSREDRSTVDEDVCGDPDVLDGLGTRALVAEVRRRTAALDPASVARRHRRAEGERHVSLRPAPDTMTYLTALLPVAEGVAAYAALQRDADSLRASDESLLGGGHEPATIPGHGPVPAQIARELVAASLDDDTQAWIRRLYADPAGSLVALTSRQRLVPGGLAQFLRLRDQGLCRTPWCDAPIRHHDHITPSLEGGPTTDTNTQGLCESCNHAKQADGWRQRTVDDPTGRHTVETTTPTGHRHRSRAPAPPRPARTARASRPFAMEIVLSDVLIEYVAA